MRWGVGKSLAEEGAAKQKPRGRGEHMRKEEVTRPSQGHRAPSSGAGSDQDPNSLRHRLPRPGTELEAPPRARAGQTGLRHLPEGGPRACSSWRQAPRAFLGDVPSSFRPRWTWSATGLHGPPVSLPFPTRGVCPAFRVRLSAGG